MQKNLKSLFLKYSYKITKGTLIDLNPTKFGFKRHILFGIFGYAMLISMLLESVPFGVKILVKMTLICKKTKNLKIFVFACCLSLKN